MKIAYINSCNYGSTGSIVNSLAEEALKRGFDCLKCFPNTTKNWDGNQDHTIIFGSKLLRNLESRLSKTVGIDYCLYRLDTLELIRILKKFEPDIIHLHNLHGGYINLDLLFRYIKQYNIKTVWTLHDCWAFTGRCPHFQISACNKWKTGCHNCPYPKNLYPQSNIDIAKKMWNLKRDWFTDVKNLTIVTPSEIGRASCRERV